MRLSRIRLGDGRRALVLLGLAGAAVLTFASDGYTPVLGAFQGQ